jgi:hypothetical protein
LAGYKRNGKKQSEEDVPREMEGGPQGVLLGAEKTFGSQASI